MTSACAALRKSVNPLLAGGYAACKLQTFRILVQTLPSLRDVRSRKFIVDHAFSRTPYTAGVIFSIAI